MPIISLSQAVDLLLRGGVGVIPTDTVYGLVARAGDENAVSRLYQLKRRDKKPGTLIAASTNQLDALGVLPSAIDQVSHWWPNSLSAVLPIEGYDYLHQGVGTLAMRVVANPQTRRLLETTGPLITSSANQPGEPPATTINEAYGYFGDDIDFYVDGGSIVDTLPSTIIRPTADGIEVLRQGSVSL